jgi:iron complex outermembrane receptor protein
MQSLRPISAAMLAAFTALPAYAQERLAATLEPVVVSGKKDPDKSTLTQPDYATAKERVEQTAGGANVIDAATYKTGRVSTLTDALSFSPGVLVQPRFGAEEARLSIRGSGAQRTFHGRGLQLMQDGVPLNLADGSFDFQAVEALSARYIEVWRGANALQYGASALGGAINFVSPNGFNSDLFSARLEAGSFGYQRAQLATGNVAENFDYYVAGNLFKQDGFRSHAQQDTQRVFANLGWTFNPDLETRFYIGAVNSDSFLPGSLTKAQLGVDPSHAAAANISGNQKRDIDWRRISNKTVYRAGTQRFELFAFASDKTLFHPIFQVIDQTNRDIGIEARYVNDAQLAGRKNRFVFGIAPARGHTGEDRWVNVGGTRGARTNQGEQIANNLDIYAENQHYVLPQLAVIAGVQHNRSTRTLNDKFIAGTAADPASESFDLKYSGTSPKLGVRADIAQGIQVFANIAKSYEPPSFSEITGGLRPVLNRAQSATSAEVGTRGTLANVQWDVALYHAKLKDELLQVGTNVVNAPITINAPRNTHSGLEAAASGTFASKLFWRGALNLNRFKLKDDPRFGNNTLPGLPKTTAQAELGYRFTEGLTASINAQHASGYPIDFAGSFFADAYTTFGAKIAHTINKQWSWFVEGRNLGNKKYAATTGIVQNARGQDQAQFLPGDGRAVYAGLEFKLN